jgi:uncharacterized repeat protein (TIGR02059 family)
VTVSGTSGRLKVQAHATGINRVTNGQIIRGTGYNLYSGPITMDDMEGKAAIVMDNITFSGDNVILDINGRGPGLLHSSKFINLSAAQEFIHIMGWGAGNTTGWTTTVSPGSGSLFYIEDCQFSMKASQPNCAWIQGYYGCRTAIRYCSFNYVSVDMHGTAGNVGARWWECYNNTFTNSSGNNHSWAYSMRAGSGVIFNNSMAVGAYRGVDIGLCEEDSGYPAAYQIGRGINQTSDPAYVWNNPGIDLQVNAGDAPEVAGMVQLNRDVFASAKPGYSPYAYPHPLRGPDTAPPTISLAAIPASGSTLVATASEGVSQGAGGGVGFTVSASGGVTAVTNVAISGASVTLTLSRTVYAGETVTLSYAGPGDGIEDGAGNDLAAFANKAVTNGSTQTIDITPPAVVSAAIPSAGTTLVAAMTENVAKGASGDGGFSVSASGGAVGVGSVNVSSTSVTLSLSRSINSGETVTLSYTQPGNGIEDSAGNDLGTFSSTSVANNSSIGSTQTGVINPSRVIAWDPGVPGGVPQRATVFADVTKAPYNADMTGATNAAAAIQSAINACPVGQVVYLPAGTYRLNSQLSITKGAVLRGAGTGVTILNSYASWHAIQIGDWPSAPVATSVSGSPAKGATQINVGSVSAPSLSVGDYIVIDQTNDGTEVVNVDAESRAGGTRCLSQVTKVVAISGTTLTIDPPLYHAYSSACAPEVWELNQGNSMTTYAGVEDLSVFRIQPQTQDGYSNFKFVAAAYCWLKNVESHNTIFWHVDLDRTFRCEIRDSLFSNGVFRSGGFTYGVVCGNRTTATRIENNRFYRCRHSMVVQGGVSGNVFGYNYSVDSDQGDGWLAGDLFPHGAHTTMNLYEGNCAAKAQSDWTHGSSSYNTFFRNFIRCKSAFATSNQGRRTVDMDVNNTYGNYLGNVLGASGITWAAEETGSTRDNGVAYTWSFGFFSDGDTTRDSTVPATTAFRHGNYSARSGTVTWDAATPDHGLPASLYMNTKPAWFGSLNWPAFDPATGATADPVNIPAGYRYINGSNPPNETRPQAPSNLRVTGQ